MRRPGRDSRPRAFPPAWESWSDGTETVPVSATLASLHDVIQIALGWTDSHLYEFEIGEGSYGGPLFDKDHEVRRLYTARSLHRVVRRPVRPR